MSWAKADGVPTSQASRAESIRAESGPDAGYPLSEVYALDHTWGTLAWI